MLLCIGTAKAQTVTLDYYFNHETHQTATGETKRFHYLWDEKADPGFSVWGSIFTKNGARLDTLAKAPTLLNLSKTNIYIIVDPDSRKESPTPNFIENKDIMQIAAWVKAGGVLVMMANDSANVELNHFNGLAKKFGMHFNNDLQNHVINDSHFSDGVLIPANTFLFKTAKRIFMKDVCSITLQGNAKPVLKAKNGKIIAAAARYGKGTVFAVGDPWLYNEYVNGRLPAGYDNDKAANDLTVWLLQQTRLKK